MPSWQLGDARFPWQPNIFPHYHICSSLFIEPHPFTECEAETVQKALLAVVVRALHWIAHIAGKIRFKLLLESLILSLALCVSFPLFFRASGCWLKVEEWSMMISRYMLTFMLKMGLLGKASCTSKRTLLQSTMHVFSSIAYKYEWCIHETFATITVTFKASFLLLHAAS